MGSFAAEVKDSWNGRSSNGQQVKAVFFINVKGRNVRKAVRLKLQFFLKVRSCWLQNQYKNWKEQLLKSGIPLENQVANILDELGFQVWGEYPYIRISESGNAIECSVDLHVSTQIRNKQLKEWGALDLLIECKYNHQDIKWVFMPTPKKSMVVTGVINVQAALCTNRISNIHPLFDFDKDLPYCVKGVLLHSRGFDPKTIQHGLNQIKYAIPRLLETSIIIQITARQEEELNIHFLCPILVTTASLHVLKHQIDIDSIEHSSKFENISNTVDALVVLQTAGPELIDYSENIIERLSKAYPGVKKRLFEAWEIFKKSKEKYLFDWDYFCGDIIHSSDRILVVNLYALKKQIKRLKRTLCNVGKHLKQFGVLRESKNGKKVWLEVKKKS